MEAKELQLMEFPNCRAISEELLDFYKEMIPKEEIETTLASNDIVEAMVALFNEKLPLLSKREGVQSETIYFQRFEALLRGHWDKVHSASKYVDIGCGTGFKASFLAKWGKLESVNIYGVDLIKSPNFIEDANFLLTDGKTIPIDNGTVDMVSFFHVLHHLEDREAIMNELKRITRKGSLLVVQDHDTVPEALEKITFTHYIFERVEQQVAVLRLETRQFWRELLAANGFKLISSTDTLNNIHRSYIDVFEREN